MQVRKVVAFDLGNGYMKRCYDGKNVSVDPAIYAFIKEQAFDLSQWDNICKINNRFAIIGTQAAITKSNAKTVVGEDDINRYKTQEYTDMLLSTLMMDLKCSTKIEKLILGLPIQHQKMGISEDIKKLFENKQFENVYLNGHSYKIYIKDVIVMPQPMGTYFYMNAKDKLDDEHILIVDGGFGTVDYNEINTKKILSSYGNNAGLKKLYTIVQEQLELKYPGTKLTLYDVQKIIDSGTIKYMGKTELVDKALYSPAFNLQFSIITDDIINRYNSYAQFDRVIFTGGFANAFKDQIVALQHDYGNIKVAENAQTANVLGFYRFGRGW
jgi:hypothetical protein